METENNQAEQGSLVEVDNQDIPQVVEDSQAVLDIPAETVESLVGEDIQDILGSFHTVDIQDTSQRYVLQTISHELLLTAWYDYKYCLNTSLYPQLVVPTTVWYSCFFQ